MPPIGSTIFGLEIPSAGPVFAAALVIHILAGLACVVTGAIAMLSQKRAGRHPRFGTIYFWGLATVFGTATIMAVIRWAENRSLLLIGAFAFSSATVGFLARRHRWRGWLYFHIAGLGLSYVAMLTAFYIDNGPRLPLWSQLPAIAFWVGPSLVGIPLISRTLARYRPGARVGHAAGIQPSESDRNMGASRTLEDYR